MTLDLLDENIFNCALEAGFTICTKDHLKNLNISESIADPETLIKFASLILQNRPSKTYVWEVYD